MAGATAFFTTFALPPILVILIQAFKLIVGGRNIRDRIIQNTYRDCWSGSGQANCGLLQSMRRLAQNWYITIGGFIFLIFVATTLFKIIKNSVNQVWKIRPHRKLGFVKTLTNRVQAVFVILVAGVLFMLGILAEGVQAFIGRYIFEFSHLLFFYFNSILNYIISVLVVTLWFMMMFRYLPDGRPRWQIAFAGGFVTAILFTIGKLILHWLLSYSNINTLYGTSASIVLLLLFVFYSSLILYYGAAFTKIWGIFQNRPIEPLPHAMHYKVTEEKLPGLNSDI